MDKETPRTIFHVAEEDSWRRAAGSGEYTAASLESEGFIHCSFRNQLGGVLERYYSGAGEVLVLEIDPDSLTSDLRIEASTGGEDFPHIYGTINVDAVIGTARIQVPE